MRTTQKRRRARAHPPTHRVKRSTVSAKKGVGASTAEALPRSPPPSSREPRSAKRETQREAGRFFTCIAMHGQARHTSTHSTHLGVCHVRLKIGIRTDAICMA
jgi:hypothetical protein